ncbi:hypothetical protein BD309DRAFT_1024536 [Dichomitus squalens]|nr:hypothetical protein BD309DRAFT_1024536 [Dichomitus squalens]
MGSTFQAIPSSIVPPPIASTSRVVPLPSSLFNPLRPASPPTAPVQGDEEVDELDLSEDPSPPPRTPGRWWAGKRRASASPPETVSRPPTKKLRQVGLPDPQRPPEPDYPPDLGMRFVWVEHVSIVLK